MTDEMRKALMADLRNLLGTNEEECDSSDGSDDAPSEDNLDQEEMKEIVPTEQ